MGGASFPLCPDLESGPFLRMMRVSLGCCALQGGSKAPVGLTGLHLDTECKLRKPWIPDLCV